MIKKKHKILFYNAIPMPHSILLQNALLSNGYDVSFWYYKDLTKVYPWKTLGNSNDYLVFGKDGNNFRKLIAQARKSDLIIITGWHTKVHVFLALYCFVFGIKFAYWLDVPENLGSPFKSWSKRFLLKMADYLLITGSEGVNRFQLWTGIRSERLIDFPYLGAIVNYPEIEKTNKIRGNHLIKGEKVRVLISNRFEPRKGYKCVYNALSLLNEDLLSCLSLTIIGSGTEFEYYEKLFNELKVELHFQFWVEYENYIEYIKNTDVLIHASFHEPYGIPPADAMAHGKLVIASDEVMSTRGRIKNGLNGYLFKSDDDTALSDILRMVIKFPANIYKIGNKALEESKSFQLEKNLDAIEKIFSNHN